MTLTLNLNPEMERVLMAQAQAKGISLVAYAEEVLSHAVASKLGEVSSTPGKEPESMSLFDLFTPVRGLLTDEEIDQNFQRNASVSRQIDLA